MTRQNRVDPFGLVNASASTGMFFGNRGGSFMRADGTLKPRHWASRQWIICVLSYKGRRHDLDNPRIYTGLFFVDEATALAAGHRPCFECRRADAKAFRDGLVGGGHLQEGGLVGSLDALAAGEIQGVLSGEASRETVAAADLPDGAMYAYEGRAFLKHEGAAQAWSFEGYGAPQRLHETGQRLTPRITCEALRAGYKPVLHPSVYA